MTDVCGQCETEMASVTYRCTECSHVFCCPACIWSHPCMEIEAELLPISRQIRYKTSKPPGVVTTPKRL